MGESGEQEKPLANLSVAQKDSGCVQNHSLYSRAARLLLTIILLIWKHPAYTELYLEKYSVKNMSF